MTRKGMVAVCALAIGASAGRSQTPTGIAVVDSAAVARAAWARAGEALRAGNRARARAEVERAANAWPTQSAYVWAGASLAAEEHDTAAALRFLGRYAALGLAHDVQRGSALAQLMDLPAFDDAKRALAENARPMVQSRARVVFGDTTFWAEGVDADPATGHLFVASIRHRTIADVAPDGSARELWPRGDRRFGAIFGVRIDTVRRVLWATTSGVPQMEGYTTRDSSIAALLKIRMSDGSVIGRWDLPAVTGGHVLGDLAVGPQGDVFMTDSNEPRLYRLRPSAKELESFTNPLFHSLQGMAPTPDGRTLYVADYSHGLLRVDLSTRAVTRLADAPSSTSLGCDGIVFYDGTIVAVQNGVTPARIVRFFLDSSGTRIARARIIDRNSAVADEPTIGTVLKGQFLYVANGQWDKHDDRGGRILGRALEKTVVLSIPLGPP